MAETYDKFLMLYLVGVLMIASFTDIRSQKIPNLLTYPTIILSLLYNLFTKGPEGLLLSLAGLVIGLFFFMIPYLKGGIGAGDVKLMGAVGAALGPKFVINAFLFTGIIGGVYALVIFLIYFDALKLFIARTRTMVKTLLSTGNFIFIPADDSEKKPRLCYALAIASGTLITMSFILSDRSLPI